MHPGHSPAAMCCKVTGRPVQPGTLHSPELSPDQCLLNQQVLYLPLNILAWTVAFLTSYGELLAEVQMGWGFLRDMKFDRKWTNEERLAACSLSFTFHQSVTLFLTRLFNCSFVGGFWTSCTWWGREYCTESYKTWQNQENLLAAGSARTKEPCLLRMCEGPSLAIIPRRKNCLIWRKAVAGNEPARKYTTGAGVALYRHCNLSRLTL